MKEELEQFVKERAFRISQTKCFIGIISENTFWQFEFCINFALAIFLDRPIYLIIKEGVQFSNHLKNLAKMIVIIKGPDDISLAVGQILAKVNHPN